MLDRYPPSESRGQPSRLRHEGEPRAPGPAVPSRPGGPQGGAGARPLTLSVPKTLQFSMPIDSWESRPCRTASGRAFRTGRPRRRIIPERWGRQRWRTRSAAGSTPPTAARTCEIPHWHTLTRPVEGRDSYNYRIETDPPLISAAPEKWVYCMTVFASGATIICADSPVCFGQRGETTICSFGFWKF